MKICSSCKVNKELKEFNNSKRTPDKLSYRCKLCSSIDAKKRYDNNPEFKEKSKLRGKVARLADPQKFRDRNNARYAVLRQDLRDYKQERGCIVCGYNKSPQALDFHHPDPDVKEGHVGKMVGCSQRMEEEKKKCVIVCCRCHREHHDGMLEIPV